MSRFHLSPRLYSSLQDFVHDGHRETFGLLISLFGISPGETVVEIGCGTGILARQFASRAYDYWGIDLDPERIAVARERAPGAHLLVCDALALDRAGLPPFRHAFIHGVLHHLDDSQCRHVLDAMLSSGSDNALIVIEPFRPKWWWTNPLGTLFAHMDEGQFVRTFEGWQALFGSNVDLLTTRSVWPRWPVGFVIARLKDSAHLDKRVLPLSTTSESLTKMARPEPPDPST